MKFNGAECGFAGMKSNGRAGSIRGTHLRNGCRGRAVLVSLFPNRAVSLDSQHQFLAERVYNTHTYTVQAAGYFVAVVVKFTARMQHRHDDLCSGSAFLRVHVNRNPAAIIGHRNRFVAVDSHINA